MAGTSSFPTNPDAIPDPSSGQAMNAGPVTHSLMHTEENDAISSVENYLLDGATVTSATTATAGERVLANASGGAFTVTLPTGTHIGVLVSVTKIDSSANAVTVACPGGWTFADGSTTITLSGQNQSGVWVSDGTSKFVIQGIQPGTYVSAIIGPVASGDTTGATDTPALQTWLNSCVAQNKLGVLPPGHYYDTGLTINGSVRLLGLGVAEAYTGGVNGDTALAGPKIQHVATSGDHLLVTPPSSTTRGHFIHDGITWIGNAAAPGATGGGGVRLLANATTSAILADLDRSNFIGAYGDCLTLEGNVFETRFGSVQCNQSSHGYGLTIKASVGGGAPGEIWLERVTCDLNALDGANFSGGGQISFGQLSCSNNTGKGFTASGIGLFGVLLVLESNAGGTFAALSNMTAPRILGVNINYGTYTTATGIALASVLWGEIGSLTTNSGAGNLDWTTDGGCQGCSFPAYTGGGFTDRYTDGGYWTVVRRGGEMFTPRALSTATATLSGTGSVTPDSTKVEELFVTVTGAGANLTVNAPVMTIAGSSQTGNRLTIDVRNNSGGAMGTIAFNAVFALAGGTALTAPANGKRRKITFEWDNATSTWVEMYRSTADT